MVRIFFIFLISGPSLLYVFKKWSEFTLKVVQVYLKSGPSLLVFQKVTNEVLYGTIEKISTKIICRFLKFAGHCLRRDDEVVSDLVLWEPTHGTRRRGRPPESYIRNLEHETGIPASDIRV